MNRSRIGNEVMSAFPRLGKEVVEERLTRPKIGPHRKYERASRLLVY